MTEYLEYDTHALAGTLETDDLYLSEAGVPTVILGPGDLAQAHVVDEHILIAEVVQAAEIYSRLAVGWLNR